MHLSRLILATSVAMILSSLVAPPTRAAEPVADFYRGKSITFLIGFGPGGGYDSYARILARHLGAHIPGEPDIVPENMPGAGGMSVTNYLYNIAPPDGLTLGMFGPFNAIQPLLGNPLARFDPTKFAWIGKLDVDAGACGAWRGSGIEKFTDLQRNEVTFGSSGLASTTTQQVLALKNLLGAKVKIVQGYKGSADITLAMRRGEVSAMCGIAASNVLVQLKDDVKNGNLKIFIQFGRKDAPEFGDATNVYDLLTSGEDKLVADIIFRPNELGKPIAAPPGMPDERVRALRDAFNATISDQRFVDEMKRMDLSINAATGGEVAQVFSTLFATPKPLIKRAIADVTVQK